GARGGVSGSGTDLIVGAGRRVVTDLGATRYDLAAAGFGCHAEHVERPDDLRPALARALAAGKPACVNVCTDRTVISPITIAMVGSAQVDSPAAAAGGTVIPYYDNLDGGS